MDYSDWAPRDVRALIAQASYRARPPACAPDMPRPTFAFCRSPEPLTFAFCMRNPRPCPILEVGEAGCRQMGAMARGDDVCTAFPSTAFGGQGSAGGRSNGYFRLLAGRFGVLPYRLLLLTLKSELLQAGVPVRHIEEGRNVPMFSSGWPWSLQAYSRQYGGFHASHSP